MTPEIFSFKFFFATVFFWAVYCFVNTLNNGMKIRYYKNLDKWRWIGFLLAMISAFILSGGNPDTQWHGWVFACASCVIWIYMGYKDRDVPRSLMEVMYLLLAFRGIYEWF